MNRDHVVRFVHFHDTGLRCFAIAAKNMGTFSILNEYDSSIVSSYMQWN
jgi:hypothetical protein